MSALRTHRPLPEADTEIERLGPEEREKLGQCWHLRASLELAASTTFAEVYRGLVELRAPHELLFSAVRAVDDEFRHAGICAHVASRYLGRELPEPTAAPTAAPHFNGCSAREARVLHVVLHTCINEGIAVAYLGACLEAATTPLVRAALRDLMQDEVVHSRLGWAFLGWAAAPERRLVEAAVPALVEHARSLWLDEREDSDELPAGHGALGLAALRGAVDSALEELIVPGFRHLGLTVQTPRSSSLGPAK